MFGRLLVKQQGHSTGCICAVGGILGVLSRRRRWRRRTRTAASGRAYRGAGQAADKRVFMHLRTKLAEVKGNDVPEQACAIVKAEAWLAVAEEEYYENEERDIVDVTLREAKRLLRTLDNSNAVAQAKVPLFNVAKSAVKDFLVKAGIPASHIATASFGKSLPLTKGRRNRDLARNRRVVFIVTNIEQIRSEEKESDLQLDQQTPRMPARHIELPAKQRQSNKVMTGHSRETR